MSQELVCPSLFFTTKSYTITAVEILTLTPLIVGQCWTVSSLPEVKEMQQDAAKQVVGTSYVASHPGQAARCYAAVMPHVLCLHSRSFCFEFFVLLRRFEPALTFKVNEELRSAVQTDPLSPYFNCCNPSGLTHPPLVHMALRKWLFPSLSINHTEISSVCCHINGNKLCVCQEITNTDLLWLAFYMAIFIWRC